MKTPSAWWHGRHRRRLAALGGRLLDPAKVGTPGAHPFTTEVEPFAPTQVDETAARAEIDSAVAGLMPGGVDEATGRPLDNMINAWADQWVSDVKAQHAQYAAITGANQKIAEATLDQVNVQAGHDRSVLSHKVLALESALLRIVGYDRAGRHQDRDPDGEGPSVQPSADGPDAGSRSRSAGGKPGRTGQDGDPADLHILLGPRERRWYTPWRDPGHADPAMLAGRPRSAYLHLAALFLAAGADIGAFSQIVQLVLPKAGNLLVYVVVIGFTATVLYLAHAFGVMLRDCVAGAGWLRKTACYFCAAIWLGLGIAAFVIRLHFQQASSAATSYSATAAPVHQHANPADKLYPAILFFALYVATGLVAAVGAYLTHNPLRASYASAARAYRRACEQSAATAFQAGAAEAHRYAYEAQLTAAEETLFHEIETRLALAEKLKQAARVQMAQHLQDPAVTDAMFQEDWRPYT
ncbi:MAG TPA: hypothetical protein VMV17_16410 [Streptosporangiaceae bacterium]|nr:hypothetical protein [Streptosporangiaceae bacterium]